MVIVGIAGGTGSGKSTLAGKLVAELEAMDLRVVLLSMDSYYKAVTPKVVSPISRAEYDEHNHPDALELPRLHGDLRALRTSARVEEDAPDVVIVEGLFALYDDTIRGMLDLKVFVDAPADERLYRRIRRNMAWGESMEAVTGRYLDTVRFRHDELVEPSRWHADIVLNGSYPSDLGLRVVAEWIGCPRKASPG